MLCVISETFRLYLNKAGRQSSYALALFYPGFQSIEWIGTEFQLLTFHQTSFELQTSW